MDIEYKGGNCVVISTKKATVAIDAKISTLGLKDITPKNAYFIATQQEFLPEHEGELVAIDQPGEYEIGNISVTGVAAKRLIDHEDTKASTMYRIDTGEVAIAVIGHVTTPLSEEQLEALGVIDIAIVPVGGSGYTLDAHQAVAAVRQLDPKIVVPTHYADTAVKYEVPQMELEPFVKELGADHEATPKHKIKNGILPEALTVVEVTRTA